MVLGYTVVLLSKLPLSIFLQNGSSQPKSFGTRFLLAQICGSSGFFRVENSQVSVGQARDNTDPAKTK